MPLDSEFPIRVRIALGDAAGMRELTKDLGDAVALRQGLESRAHALALNHRELLGESERLLGWWEDRYDEQPDAWFRRYVAYWVLPLASRVNEVVHNLEEMARDSVDRWDIKGMLGVSYARVGRMAAADSIDAILAAADPAGLRGLLSLWRARLAAQQGRRDEAVSLLSQAFREGTWVHPAFPGWSSYWHTDPDFEVLRGYPPYERLVAPK